MTDADAVAALEALANDNSIAVEAAQSQLTAQEARRRKLIARTVAVLAAVEIIRKEHGPWVERAANLNWDRLKQSVAHDSTLRVTTQRAYRTAIDLQVALAYADRDAEGLPAALLALDGASDITLKINLTHAERALDAAETPAKQLPTRISELRQQLAALQLTIKETK